MKKYACLVPLAFALAACGSNESSAPVAATPKPAVPAAADQPAQPTPPQSAQALADGKLDAILAGAWRSDANKARDAYRHPKQTLEFFGVKPGQTLVEITPGGGWYAEILAPLMKGNGTYIAAVSKPRRPEGEAAQDKSALQKKFEGDAERYGEAKSVEFDAAAPSFGAPGSADVVVTFRNVHNWVGGGNAEAMFKAFFDVLKPGGTLGVADHRAAAGVDFEKIKDSGYIPEDMVIKFAADAGFKLEAKSEVNANPKDTKDYPNGVWTLPPVLTNGDVDKAKYLAIGESDRMTLRFVKPKK